MFYKYYYLLVRDIILFGPRASFHTPFHKCTAYPFLNTYSFGAVRIYNCQTFVSNPNSICYWERLTQTKAGLFSFTFSWGNFWVEMPVPGGAASYMRDFRTRKHKDNSWGFFCSSTLGAAWKRIQHRKTPGVYLVPTDFGAPTSSPIHAHNLLLGSLAKINYFLLVYSSQCSLSLPGIYLSVEKLMDLFWHRPLESLVKDKLAL